MGSLVFLNSHRAKSGRVDDRELPKAYVHLARFFSCGPIDRTGTLDMNVDYQVLQPIPEERTDESFGEVCRQVAADLIAEAVTNDQRIDVAWSGGIDSTVALVALMAGLEQRGELRRLRVMVSTAAIDEYPWFHQNVIMPRLATRALARTLPEALADNAITVTGEHGDQLFGSDKLERFVRAGTAQMPYRHVMPFYMAEVLRSEKKAAALMEYLAPQIASAPVPIETTFDFMWWCNFSLKWQQVNLRIPVFRGGEVGGLRQQVRHFFADARFQAWALSNSQVRKVRDWRAYKLDAKRVVLDATGDFEYFTHKEKAPSLKNVIVDRRKQGNERYRVHMYDDYQVRLETFERKDF
jgi:hypothetical protein